ncbi:MAG: DUF192 domain-containing protein [Spirochaetales bacterium]|nr:DUF192 domain-containing protein [Spirochaetales bacterium]
MKLTFTILISFLIACNGLTAPSLKKETIYIGTNKLTVEIAATPESRERGLMYRSSLDPDHGMLFVFRKPDVQTFWMKNTLIPLDIGFFDDQGFLILTHSMDTDDGKKRYSSMEPALYAVETDRGWFEKKQIRKYAELKLPYPMKGL